MVIINDHISIQLSRRLHSYNHSKWSQFQLEMNENLTVVVCIANLIDNGKKSIRRRYATYQKWKYQNARRRYAIPFRYRKWKWCSYIFFLLLSPNNERSRLNNIPGSIVQFLWVRAQAHFVVIEDLHIDNNHMFHWARHRCQPNSTSAYNVHFIFDKWERFHSSLVATCMSGFCFAICIHQTDFCAYLARVVVVA